jgi:hypothetical protein
MTEHSSLHLNHEQGWNKFTMLHTGGWLTKKRLTIKILAKIKRYMFNEGGDGGITGTLL